MPTSGNLSSMHLTISFVSKGINLNDGEKQIDLYFFSKTAQKVYELLNLK